MKKKLKIEPFYGSSVFGKHGFAGLGILLVLSILLEWPELIWVLISCLVILIISRFWARQSLAGFALAESVPVREVFPGEEVAIEFQIHNQKRLPLPWAHLETDGLQRYVVNRDSDGMVPEEDPSAHAAQRIIYKLGWISGNEKVLLKSIAKLPRRGIYKVSASKAVTGDPFSLFCSERILQGSIEVIVYPRLLDFIWQELGIKSPNGNISDNNFVFTDPAYKIGLRDYLPSDSLKSINWAGSTRFQTLKSNLLEGKAVSRSLIFLDGESLMKTDWDGNKRDLAWELLLSGIASLAFFLSSSDKEWDFITDVVDNAPKNCGWQPYLSTSPAHKARQLLVRLAGIDANHPLADPLALFKKASNRSGLTLIVFSSQYNPCLASAIEKAGKFRQIRWLVLDKPDDSGDDVVPLRLGWDEDLKLKQLLCG